MGEKKRKAIDKVLNEKFMRAWKLERAKKEKAKEGKKNESNDHR
ncbi:MAG: hypothetical protein WC455_25975 [Dehalococcoidia bacterium]|jgi:hypothetical protein